MCAVDVSRKLLTATRRMFPTLLEKRESVAGQPKAAFKRGSFACVLRFGFATDSDPAAVFLVLRVQWGETRCSL